MTTSTSMEQVEQFLAAIATEIAEQVAARMAASQPPATRLLRLDEAGVMLGISERAVRKLIAVQDGETVPRLASVLVGDGARRVEVSVVEAYIESLRGGR